MAFGRTLCLLSVVATISLVGCASARHVEIFPDGGVVAIPSNTNSWPYHYRDKAVEMIEAECPNGYEIVYEGEEVARRVTHIKTDSRADQTPMLLFGGAQDPGEGLPPPGSPLSSQNATIAVPLTPPREHATSVAEERDVTEWRIHYRRR